jgi:hypothetical protein
VIIALNRQDQLKQVMVPVGTIGLKDGVTLKSVIGDDTGSRVINGEARLKLPSQSAIAFQAF